MGEDMKKIADDMMKDIEKKLNTIKNVNAGWGKILQVNFTDIDVGYIMKFAMDGTVEKITKVPASELKAEEAEVTLRVNVQDLKDIMDHKITGAEAMADGLFQFDGNMMALQKLTPAFT
jgi:putative sterol carrier protein